MTHDDPKSPVPNAVPNRTPLRRVHPATWALVIAAAATLACATQGAVAQEAPRAPAPARVSADTLRDVEVMRRVLAKEALGIGGIRPVTSLADPIVYVSTAGSGSGASEAYLVPGDGATFVLRTSDSVAPSGETADAADPKAEPTAWDEAVADLEGKPRTRRKVRSADRYDTAKVDALRARILEQLASFGDRIRGLAASDHLTVIVTGGAGGAMPIVGRVVGPDGEAAGATSLTSRFEWAYVNGLRGSSAASVLTIRVAVSDCQASARGSLSPDEFARRAVVSAYRTE